MATTDELRELDGCEYGHAIFISGIGWVFVDHSDLAGYNFGGSRTGRLGLTRDGLSWRDSANMRKSLMDDNPWSFTVVDFDGTLARLFAAVDDTERSLGDVPIGFGLPIQPNDSLAARTELHDKNVGTERIGPNGERNIYPAPAGVTFAPKHSIATPGLDLGGAPVSDNPIVWAGRRVVLYRIYRDHVTYPDRSAGTVSWRPFDEAVKLHWGTLRDEGSVKGREWTLEADGKSSWLRKPLFVGAHPTPVRAVADFTLSTDDGANETGVAVQLSELWWNGTPVTYGGRAGVTDITGTTVDEIRQTVIDEIAAAVAAATDHTGSASSVWEDQAGYHAHMEFDSTIMIQIAEDNTNDPKASIRLCLHRTVWALLGFDIDLQGSMDPDPNEPRAITFDEVGINGSFAPFAAGYGPGYVTATMYTGLAEWEESGGPDNGGAPRFYKPQYTGGTAVLSKTQIENGGQVVRLADATLGLGASGSTVAHPGQHDRPVASSPSDPDAPIEIDGVACDRQGLWLLYGQRRFSATEEVFPEYQVVRASWKNALAGLDGLVSGDVIIVTEILLPRQFGFDRPPLGSDGDSGEWVVLESSADEDGGRMNALPLATLGYNTESTVEWAHILAQRLIYGTGTSNGWVGYGDAAVQDPGDNEPNGDHTIVRDAEIAELGLAIPYDMVHDPEVWRAEADKVEDDDILKVKLAITPGYQAMDAIRSMLQPVGWSMHLRDGKYGIWCPADPVTQGDVQVVLTRTTKRGADGGGIRFTPQDIRKWAAVDKWTYQYNYNPKERKTTKELEMLAPDSGLRYRPGEVHELVMAHGKRGTANGVGNRVAHLSKWWSRRHFEVKGWPVHAVNPGERCWLGTIVRITDATLVDVLGEYGVTGRLGVITGVTHTLGVEKAECKLDLLVFADRSALPRLHAISARSTAYDSVARTFTTEENWLRIESDGSWRDAPKFDEPEYEEIEQFGGAAKLAAYQWNGDTWSRNLTGDVRDTTDTTIELVNGTVAGTYYRDMDTILVLRPADEQDAGEWPLEIYSPICDAAGLFVPPGGGTQDGYPWEP